MKSLPAGLAPTAGDLLRDRPRFGAGGKPASLLRFSAPAARLQTVKDPNAKKHYTSFNFHFLNFCCSFAIRCRLNLQSATALDFLSRSGCSRAHLSRRAFPRLLLGGSTFTMPLGRSFRPRRGGPGSRRFSANRRTSSTFGRSFFLLKV